jgi:PadR family transcriptional regulator AphA
MDIKYAILGFLSWRPFTGYDLKKMIAGSVAFHWSGNNNQIYTALLQLKKEELVIDQVEHQEHYPSRKVYTITDKGLAALRDWVGSQPELPQRRSTFLVQLAWADQLGSAELDALLEKYEHEIDMQLLMCREQQRRGGVTNPARTPREAYLWDMIFENHALSYETELGWVRKLRGELAAKE